MLSVNIEQYTSSHLLLNIDWLNFISIQFTRAFLLLERKIKKNTNKTFKQHKTCKIVAHVQSKNISINIFRFVLLKSIPLTNLPPNSLENSQFLFSHSSAVLTVVILFLLKRRFYDSMDSNMWNEWLDNIYLTYTYTLYTYLFQVFISKSKISLCYSVYRIEWIFHNFDSDSDLVKWAFSSFHRPEVWSSIFQEFISTLWFSSQENSRESFLKNIDLANKIIHFAIKMSSIAYKATGNFVFIIIPITLY